jgi:hypothetical protein
MDFTRDTLRSRRVFRALNLVDELSRESLAIEVDTSLPGIRVVRVLERLGEVRGLPEASPVPFDENLSVELRHNSEPRGENLSLAGLLGGWCSLLRTSLGVKFADLQGKYREIRRFQGGSDVRPVRNRNYYRYFFSEFPKIWNREIFLSSREVSNDIRELSRGNRVAAHRGKRITISSPSPGFRSGSRG